jgi:hypothetical protein
MINIFSIRISIINFYSISISISLISINNSGRSAACLGV